LIQFLVMMRILNLLGLLSDVSWIHICSKHKSKWIRTLSLEFSFLVWQFISIFRYSLKRKHFFCNFWKTLKKVTPCTVTEAVFFLSAAAWRLESMFFFKVGGWLGHKVFICGSADTKLWLKPKYCIWSQWPKKRALTGHHNFVTSILWRFL
jgi:hypothetical protein